MAADRPLVYDHPLPPHEVGLTVAFTAPPLSSLQQQSGQAGGHAASVELARGARVVRSPARSRCRG